jgi:hypothetical protein
LAAAEHHHGVDADICLLDDELVFRRRTGKPENPRNVAQRGVGKAAERAALGQVTPKMLRGSFCSLAGRWGVDPIRSATDDRALNGRLGGHYARSFGKAQRDEARDRMLAYGFGAVADTDEEAAAAEDEAPAAP